ncbi:hypothetical protein G7Y79_00019g047370 [Physcia stellaris]|nr:hypothetical protein G7Y79_00019g047370 [Physcia stellaris]
MLFVRKEAFLFLGLTNLLEGAMAKSLQARQDSSSRASGVSAASSAASRSGSHSQLASAAASASTLPSRTGSITSATELSGTRTSSTSATSGATSKDAGQIIVLTAPPFTETRSSAWHAHGVNATVNSTWVFTGTNTASTATSLPAGAVITGTGGNITTIADIPENFIACRINATIKDQSPFCSPEYGQQLWVGHVYSGTPSPVNWNPTIYSDNATNHVEIHNANSTDGKDLLYTSKNVANIYGSITLEMLHEYLLNQAGNDTDSASNLTFTLVSTPAGGTENRTSGPIINLTLDPSTLPKIHVTNPIPTKKGLEIGLPIGLVAFQAQLEGDATLRERLHAEASDEKGRQGGDRGIELNDYDFDSSAARADKFEDEPTRGGNAFRDEIERQKEEEYRSRPQKITSF